MRARRARAGAATAPGPRASHPPPSPLPCATRRPRRADNKRLDEWVKPERITGYYLPDADEGEDGEPPRRRRRAGDDHGDHADIADPQLAALEKEHEEITKVKNIPRVELGRHEIECWYYAPYPDEFSGTALKEDALYVCEYCLRYMKRRATLERHKRKCSLRHPPGDEIYRDKATGLSVFEIDGKDNKIYCQVRVGRGPAALAEAAAASGSTAPCCVGRRFRMFQR